MAGSASDYLENKIIDHVLGKTSFAMPANVYIALLLGAPGEANSAEGIQEVANLYDYARIQTSGSDWAAASGGSTSNAQIITGAQANGGSFGIITHFAIMTSGVYGEGFMLLWGTITTPKEIADGDTPRFAAGTLVVTCD